jgi:lipid-A-disaccharide synthase-like uncharacterized protein
MCNLCYLVIGPDMAGGWRLMRRLNTRWNRHTTCLRYCGDSGPAQGAFMHIPAAVTSPPDWEYATFAAIGIAGQVLFTLRMFTQWVASERARASVTPRSFWWMSIGGTLLLLVYAWHDPDPVLLIAPTLNLFLYTRNLTLSRGDAARRAGGWLLPAAAVMVASGVLAAILTAKEKAIFAVNEPAIWLVVGLVGTGLWTLRFPVQWIVAERTGRSTLPPVFWWMSLAGAVMLTAYAAYKPDVVFILAYALTPIPIIRNLMLIHRKRLEPAAEPADDSARVATESA